MVRRPLFLITCFGAVIFIVAAFFGFEFTDDFWGNFLAEIAGIGLGVLVSVAIVDRLIKRSQKNQWARTREFVLNGIASHLSGAMADIFVFIPTVSDHRPLAAIIEGITNPSQDTVDAVNAVASQMQHNPQSPDRNRYLSDSAVEWYDQAKWDLDQIQAVHTPRAIDSYAEQSLIDALMAFDAARRRFHNATIGHQRALTDTPYPAMIDLVRSAADLYSELVNQWPSDTESSKH